MTKPSPATVTPLHVPTWALALAVVAVFAFYLLTQENGMLLTASQAQFLHEVTHDARHALGVPCH
jgi:cobalt transporter subunit CbtB